MNVEESKSHLVHLVTDLQIPERERDDDVIKNILGDYFCTKTLWLSYILSQSTFSAFFKTFPTVHKSLTCAKNSPSNDRATSAVPFVVKHERYCTDLASSP